MVDPLKAYEVAVAATVSSLQEMISNLSQTETRIALALTYQKYATENAATMKQHMAEMKTAYDVIKETKGLTPAKATEHLKAIHAILSFAKEDGVDLTNPVLEPKEILFSDDIEVDTVAWMPFAEYFAAAKKSANEIKAWEKCHNCGGSFDPNRTGWWDDLERGYCHLECLSAAIGTEGYMPSMPKIAYRSQDGGTAPAWGAGKGHIHNTTIAKLKARRSIKGLSKGEHWLGYAKAMGLWRPDWFLTDTPTTLFSCEGCKCQFNIYAGGWKTDNGEFFCGRDCIEYIHGDEEGSVDEYGDQMHDGSGTHVELVVPTLTAAHVYGDNVGCYCEVPHESWVSFMEAEGEWDKPEAVWS